MLFFVKENEMNIIASTKLTMTSREIADLVGSRHDKVKQSIQRLATPKEGSDPIIGLPPLGEYLDTLGRPATEYVFSGEKGKRDSIIVVAQLSPEFTARLVDRWQELEAQVTLPPQPQQPMLPSTQAKVFIRDALEVSALFDVPVHIAQVEAVKGAKLTYGVDYTPYLLNAPAQNNIKAEDEMLEPTEFGKQLGMRAIKFNLMLADFGLQERVDGAWVPTEWAKGLYSRHQWVKGSKSGYNYKWKVSAITKMFEQTEEVEEQ